MNKPNAILEAQALTKRYGDNTALDSLDLRIEAGEVFCLLGANGAGKSTTISLFMGFRTPDSGSAKVEGIVVHQNVTEARRRSAFLPETVALYHKLTGLENLRFFDELAGHNRTQAELSELLLTCGLPQAALHKRAEAYSKGMRQKVGIAIAMAKGARALLLDEPLSGLDPSAASELGQQILALRSAGCGVLMATHDIFRAKEIGDRIGIMMGGSLVQVLDPGVLDASGIESIYLEHLNNSEQQAHAVGDV